MEKKSKNASKKGNIKRIIIILVLLAIITVVLNIAKNYRNDEISNKINLIINNNNVTVRLKNDLIIENNVTYISMEDIKNFFDKYICLDENTNQIITTYNKKIASLELENSTIEINGAQKHIYATTMTQNETIYMPISEMQDVYDMELNNINNKTITIDSLDREQIKAYVKKKTAIKAKTSILSKTIEKIDKGSWVIYISDVDNKWSKIRTENGNIGYIKKDKLTNFVTIRENMEEEKQISEKVNLVWDYYSEYAKAPDRTETEIEGINVISPSFFYIDEQGKFQENVGTEGEKYIEWAHSKGYKVWPMVSNANSKIDITSKILNDYNLRQDIIENIVKVCVKYNLDGINIDFENMYKEDKDKYSQFIIELTPRIKEIGLVTSVDVTAPDGSDTWSLCFDRNVIGDVADYIIFMAYDQYGTSSNKAGTTAGYNWVETSLKKFIETEEIKSDKIILGIPFYTRLWTEKGEELTSKAVNMKDIDETIPKNIEKQWDDNLKQYYIEYSEKNATKKMWIEDEESIKEKLGLIGKYNLAGVASWEKDREKDNIWSLIYEILKNDNNNNDDNNDDSNDNNNDKNDKNSSGNV